MLMLPWVPRQGLSGTRSSGIATSAGGTRPSSRPELDVASNYPGVQVDVAARCGGARRICSQPTLFLAIYEVVDVTAFPTPDPAAEPRAIVALRELLATADPGARSDFAAAFGPLCGRGDRDDLAAAVLSAAYYPSANAAAAAVGVSAHTIADRRRRAAHAAGLDPEQPVDRLLLVLGVVAGQRDEAGAGDSYG
jgi:hypothetical protein